MSKSHTPSGLSRPCPYCKHEAEAPSYAVEDDGSECFHCPHCGKPIVVHMTTIVRIKYAKRPKPEPTEPKP